MCAHNYSFNIKKKTQFKFMRVYAFMNDFIKKTRKINLLVLIHTNASINFSEAK